MQGRGDGRTDEVREQGRERVGELLHDGGAHVHAVGSGQRPRRRRGGDRRAQRGDRPGLDQEELTLGQRPLDVLRGAEVGVDAAAQVGERHRLRVGEDRNPTLPGGDGSRGRPAGRQHGAHPLLGGRAREHRVARDDDLVGGDLPADDGLPQPERRVDDRFVAASVGGVGGEQDARGIGVHESLHHHGEAHRGWVDARTGAIGDRPVGPQRRPAAAHRVHHGSSAVDVR